MCVRVCASMCIARVCYIWIVCTCVCVWHETLELLELCVNSTTALGGLDVRAGAGSHTNALLRAATAVCGCDAAMYIHVQHVCSLFHGQTHHGYLPDAAVLSWLVPAAVG